MKVTAQCYPSRPLVDKTPTTPAVVTTSGYTRCFPSGLRAGTKNQLHLR